MKVAITLAFDIDSDLTKEQVIDRLAIFDYSSLYESFDILDEVAEIKDIELTDIH